METHIQLARKIITVHDWEKMREQHSLDTIVFTNGCFDILHRGHIEYLTEAKEQGDYLIVGLNTDASVKRLKGENRPINCEEDRALMLAALECVDYVILFDEDTPEQLIRSIKPDILVKGGDYTPEQIVGAPFVLKDGGSVLTIPFVDGYSTTQMIERILKESK